MSKHDLLIEIGTEELPPRALGKLSEAFCAEVKSGLEEAQLDFASIKPFAAPRRLALLVSQLDDIQPDKNIEKRGPALQAAYDEEGCATKAAEGFARSCGVKVEDLHKLETDKGAWLVYHHKEEGQATTKLVPAIVTSALDKLPIPKRMRWGDLDAQFVRPVHWIILLFGTQVIDSEILSVKTGNQTRGHRFHHPQPITIAQPAEYEMLLESQGKVIADFDRRKQAIRGQVEEIALTKKGHAVIDEELLDEVTAMVEWPDAIIGNFEERFLEVPQETLISTMSANQKYFHVVDDAGRLMPHFITISNIESKNPARVIEGNERVIRPRFSDAEFFWNQDRKTRLDQRVDSLASVVFQKQLGSLLDKTRRVARLAEQVAERLGGNKQLALRAAELCKCDLMTDMVFEFTDLQGVMGRYYAENDGEDPVIANALDDYYKPRFAGDELPDHPVSQALAIADRLDTLTGIFAIGQLPTGTKDPFALRRAALGVLRIIIEQKLDLDLYSLIQQAANNHDKSIKASDAVDAVFDYMLERLNAYYKDQDISADVRDAVLSLRPHKPLDIHNRVYAVTEFRKHHAAESLAAANKRIGNILKKVSGKIADQVDENLLQDAAEKTLNDKLNTLKDTVQNAINEARYHDALNELASLRESVDSFFDDVMVMTDDEALKNNRIALLNQLHGLFMQIADISRLQG
ncbi:MAG: glycine--tRNA ligase subunit beta [Thioalkalispiraceae bacterium]|jgi:glycyl-tRNA synthetase beta chain